MHFYLARAAAYNDEGQRVDADRALLILYLDGKRLRSFFFLVRHSS